MWVDDTDGQPGEEYWRDWPARLTNTLPGNARVYAYSYPTRDPVAHNGADLARYLALLAADGVETVVLVGHSMGGLVARSAASVLTASGGHPGLVAAIVSIGTPHSGFALKPALDRLFRWKSTRGGEDALQGLPPQPGEPPLVAIAGKLNPLCGGVGAVDGFWRAIVVFEVLFEQCEWLTKKGWGDNDGLVPLFSAQPTWALQRPGAFAGHDHLELIAGDGAIADPANDLVLPEVRFWVSRFLVPPRPAIGLTPAVVALSATTGAPIPVTSTVAVTNAGTALLDGLSVAGISYSSGEPGSWLTASLVSASAPTDLLLQADPSGLTPGIYHAVVSVAATADGVTNSPLGLPVTFRVDPTDLSVPGLAGNMNATVLGGTLYVAGGTAAGAPANCSIFSTATLSYDPSSASWASLSAVPDDAGLVLTSGLHAWGGRLFLVGGQRCNAVTSAAHVFDPTSNSWAQLPDLPYLSANGAGAVLGDQLFVLYSSPEMPDGSGVVTLRFSRYDFLANSWTSLAAPPLGQATTGIAALGSLVVAVGGYDPGTSATVARVQGYDPGLDAWVALPPLTTARGNHAVVNVGGKLWAIGGATGFITLTTSVEIYDPVTSSWSAGPPLPEARADHQAVVLAGRVCVVGGYGSNLSTPLSSVRCIDPASLSAGWH